MKTEAETGIMLPQAKGHKKPPETGRNKEEFSTRTSDRTMALPIDGSPICFLETLQARREWQKIFQVMRTRGLQPRRLYPARLSIKIEGQIKSFSDKRSLKEYTSTKPALQEMLKGLL